MKKYFIALGITLLGFVGTAHATTVFNSNQLAPSPASSTFLETNGATSTWATIPSGGITSINGNANAAQTFTSGNGISVTSANGNTTTTNTGVLMFNGGTGAATYAVSPGSGISVTTSTTSSTVSLNINNGTVQNCSNQVVTGLNSLGIITCSATVNSIAGLSTGTITLIPGTNITISTTTNSITINSTGGGVSTSTSNTWLGTQAFATTTVASLNNIQYVPANYATNGCAGVPGPMNWQTCVYDIYASMAPSGGGTIWQTFDVPTSTTTGWTGLLSFNINGDQVSFNCTANIILPYVGTSTSNAPWLPAGNYALNFDFGNPVGHSQTSNSGGCDIRGNPALIVAGQTNTVTSTLLWYGGSYSYTNNTLTATTSNAGAVGVNIDYNINGGGRNVGFGANAYVDNFTGTSSGGNCGNILGCLLYASVSQNSGERLVLQGGTYTDPGNSTTSNAIYITSGGNESLFFNFNSADDVQLYCGASNAQCNISFNNYEYSAPGVYPAYIPIINPSSDLSTQLTVIGNEFADDGTPVFLGLVQHGGQLDFESNHIDMYGGGTTAYMVDHSNDNGLSSDRICQNQVQGGTVTNIVNGGGGETYSQARAATCINDVGNSFAIAMLPNASNINDILVGNNNVATFDQNGNWTLGIAADNSTVTIQKNLSVISNELVGGTLNVTSTATFRATSTFVGNIIGVPTNAFAYWSSAGVLTTTSTPSQGSGSGNGNLFVTPTSSVLANNVIAFTTAASSTVDATTSIYTLPNGDTSIGNSTDSGLFSVVNASNTVALNVASTTNNSLALLVGDHMGYSTSSVSVTSCGTGSPTVLGSDNAGAIVTGTSASSCTLTFAKNWVNPPVCFVSDSNTTAVVDVSSISSSSVVFSLASALSAVNIYYGCFGNPQ